ncbi:MAG: cytochrome c [Saprospiraceae bacterium]|nr:cytochrome c [Saprospiraceae bacterium]
MYKFLFAPGVLFLLISCESGVKNPKKEFTGKEIFKNNCVLCHGIKGDLMTNGAKDLRLSEMKIEERILIITKGRNVMTGFEDKLGSEEIRKVAEYTMTLKEQ